MVFVIPLFLCMRNIFIIYCGGGGDIEHFILKRYLFLKLKPGEVFNKDLLDFFNFALTYSPSQLLMKCLANPKLGSNDSMAEPLLKI